MVITMTGIDGDDNKYWNKQKVRRGYRQWQVLRIDKIKKRTKSLKMKTISLADNIPIISSSFNAIEVQRIITCDGFGYFSTIND